MYYIYKDGIYTFVSECLIKSGRDWIQGVIYSKNGRMYVRNKGDFEAKFRKIERQHTD